MLFQEVVVMQFPVSEHEQAKLMCVRSFFYSTRLSVEELLLSSNHKN